MNKRLFLLFFVMVVSITSRAEGFLIQNFHGVNCILHTVKADESFYEVAQRYSIRPSTLAVVNSVSDVEAVTNGKVLYIPLTETNFYTTKGIRLGDKPFLPVYYKATSAMQTSEVAENFGVSFNALSSWNPKYSTGIVEQGDRLIIGWVKHDNELNDEDTPNFIRKEKIIFGNVEERRSAQRYIKQSKAKESTKVFPNYSIPDEVLPLEKKRQRIVRSKTPKKTTYTKRKQPKKKVTEQKIVEYNETKPKSSTLRDEEKEFLKKKKLTTSKKKRGLFTSLKKLTKNSYARKKEGYKNVPNVTNEVPFDTKENKGDTKKMAVKNSPQKKVIVEKKAGKAEVINKTTKTKPKKEAIEKNEDPLYLENKMQRLTLLKSTKGRGAFFYSGTAGAKFYVFTNLANKGGVIKITNLANGRYILAEVIGPLDEADRTKGYIIKISDNSKQILGTKSSSFSSKVNY